MSLATTVVLDDVLLERFAQDLKWGQQNHPDGTGDEMFPEGSGFRKRAADAARLRCQAAFADGRGTWLHVLEEEVHEAYAESDPVKLREELIQVAAVAVAWAEAIDRRET